MTGIESVKAWIAIRYLGVEYLFCIAFYLARDWKWKAMVLMLDGIEILYSTMPRQSMNKF
jgi:hypothetical protein